MAGSERALRERLLRGLAIPAHPLALTRARRLDERRQRALTRYYVDAGAGGLAVAVHTTQFAIREPRHGLLRPVLELAMEEARAAERGRPVMIAGVVGRTEQALAEAALARGLGYDAALLGLAALRDADDAALLAHCRAVGEVIPLVGFYLQPAVGGRALSYDFWRAFAEIPSVVAIKVAPFDRYRTLDVARAVAEAVAETGRDDVALYTGNDDAIVADLVTPVRATVNGREVERRIVGGLLGQWAVWTRRAVELLERATREVDSGSINLSLLALGARLTDANAAIFDARNAFAGCIAGIHEVLRAQGLLEGTWCLDEREGLSPGQAEEIARVRRAYPELADDDFVREGLDRWLR